jgi:proto-oncogene tyrosine-protein kinase ROS
MMPVRWMAPESLIDKVFTTQSDVWGFGVLLWEIITMGQTPYHAKTNQEVMEFVPAGGHLDIHSECPERLQNLMLRCWSYNPEERPTFAECLEQIRELLVYKVHIS